MENKRKRERNEDFMVLFSILDIKEFMSKLLVQDTFHCFLVSEVEVQTGNYYQISGRRNQAWFTKDELEQLEYANYSNWSELKSLVYQLIKGNKTPMFFKIVFLLSPNMVAHFLEEEKCDYKVSDISGLYINICYEKKELHLVTATALNIFSMERTIDHLWDNYITTFLKKNKISCEIKS